MNSVKTRLLMNRIVGVACTIGIGIGITLAAYTTPYARMYFFAGASVTLYFVCVWTVAQNIHRIKDGDNKWIV